MRYNVFYDQAQAVAAQVEDFKAWRSVANDAAYLARTNCWGEVRQRLDGAFVYPVCPVGDQTHPQEDKDPVLWFGEDAD